MVALWIDWTTKARHSREPERAHSHGDDQDKQEEEEIVH
jgi:hypothetical protein